MVNGYKVIDAHCHIYPQKIAEAAVSATDKFYNTTSTHKGTTDALMCQMDKTGVDKAVIQSVATTPKQVSSINHFIKDEVLKNPDKFTGLGTLHPDSSDIEADVNELISLGLKGVKLHPDIQRFKIDDYRCLKIYELCEKHNLPILMHTGDYRYDYSNPNRLSPILEIYKDLIVVGAHLGGWSIWEEASKTLSKYENLYVDTSSSINFAGGELCKRVINNYGTDRVMFATDFPMGDQSFELSEIFKMGFKGSELEKIFYFNSAKIYSVK